MSPKLSTIAVEGIELALSQPVKLDLYEIAAVFNTTYESVRYRRYQMRVREALGWDPRQKPGPQSLITPDMEEALLEHISIYNDLYQEEMADFLYDQYGIKPSVPVISKLLKRRGITNKKLKIIAQQQNEELIRQFHDDARWWRADQLITVDESAYTEKTGDRKYGWAESGMPASIKRFLKRSERWSLLPAYSIEGYEDCLLFQGGITTAIFEDWLEHSLLPRCGRWPEPKSIIIMDNCAIHRSQRVLDLCAAAGVWIRWLPPYSPFLNPIEESFHDLKLYIRKHYRKRGGDYPSFPLFLEQMVREYTVGPDAAKRARAHFRNCGYSQVPED